jgi:lipoyl(octanoyl) transferase
MMTPTCPIGPLDVYLLGEVPFADLQQLQRRLRYDLGEGGSGSLVLCEHPPTITVGRSGSRAHIVPDDDWLARRSLRTIWVNRGGGCVLHVPGQLAAYAIVPLDRLGLDLQGHLDRLTRTLLGVLSEFDLKGTTFPGHSSVFLGRSRVASIGIAVHQWVAYYGFTINVGPFLGPFRLLAEPGLNSLPLYQTSMEARRQRPVPMAKVREALIRQFESAYGYPGHHLYTSHPLVRRNVLTHVFATSLG